MVHNVMGPASISTDSGTGQRPFHIFLRRCLAHKGLLIGLTILGAIVLVALFASVIAPHDPYQQAIVSRRLPPLWADWIWGDPRAQLSHPLGTDKLGRDYLSRLIYGARISLIIGFTTVLISGLIGTTLGVAAGYFGGWIDLVVSFLITTRLALPVVLVALAVVALHGSSLAIIILVLGLLLWDRFAVVMRAVTQQARSQEYVAAAQTIGCSTLRIVLSEILPNVTNSLIVVATVEMATAILFEAALSFLGLGVQPPLPSWGLMLAEAKEDIFFAPWMITVPGLALFLLILSINMIGDGIRDISAPESRR
ncbi:ABC transporter permease [Bosea vestrisii]|uniref:ABC transporter permease n=1 Tax=Bosea vestrisii TaxID=151416 RepID=A0ABW0H5C3_9HYPH